MTCLFETERLRLRPWADTDADADAMLALYGDEAVTRFLGMDAFADRGEARAFLRAALARGARYPDGMGGFPLERRDTGAVVGVGLIKPLPDAHGALSDDVEIGWHLAVAHQGRGYATEAGHGLLRHGFEALDLRELRAVVHEDNVASQAVCERLGMRRVGLVRAWYRGEPLVEFRLSRAVWRARQVR